MVEKERIKQENQLITGEKVYLRMARESDVEEYYAYLNDLECNKFTGSLSMTFTREITENWLKKIIEVHEDRIDLLVCVNESDEFIGEVVLLDIDKVTRAAGIRIGLISSRCEKGYGSEAMQLMLNYAFTKLNLHRVELEVYAFNIRAIHVYEKLGFVREGVKRDFLFQEGTYHDMVMMSMLEDEYRKKYGKKLI
ncbi:GNAT family N-acetyltransferase [Brevibacillus daliensis]|uniref:GNAT family N-acetyltransferase n=1 Tax=Brevibacillus daliensis TaxID=2892995 RepID=UPI001E4E32BE|nr:GNAT family protein [Brevibacillus daliensis]